MLNGAAVIAAVAVEVVLVSRYLLAPRR